MYELGFQVLRVQYEALATQPKQELEHIVNFLVLPWDDLLLQHHQLAHAELTSANLAVGLTQVDRAIDNNSIGRWRSIFTPKQLGVIDRFVELSADRHTLTTGVTKRAA
jgi:hypothetical protein